jgi:hypothetical protein
MKVLKVNFLLCSANDLHFIGRNKFPLAKCIDCAPIEAIFDPFGRSTTIDLPVVAALVAVQETHPPPLLAGPQVGRLWHRVTLAHNHLINDVF